GAVEMKLEPFDDESVQICYEGPGLEIRSMQVTCPDPDEQGQFTADTRAFVADGGELRYRVGVRIALAGLPGPSAHHGDLR
ncbi:MAG TPA: hypothetical protein VN714_18465, partial [Trebonia sp.]|nr:hypothetical protein [Trebonia sp.]